MTIFGTFSKNAAMAVVDALERSLAVIEFKPDGTIIRANGNFLQLMGYEVGEVLGQHHRIFMPAGMAETLEYQQFWDDLRTGSFKSAAFPRQTKDGRQVWIEATYNPVLTANGRVEKIVKLASDITARQEKMADLEGKVDAINRSQAVIEFDLSGHILGANENFLSVMGYDIGEILGKHHRLFIEVDYGQSAEYASFWDDLRKGQFCARQFKRLAKNGKEVWIEASYNPIFDPNGKVSKVVKFATDITEQVQLLTQLKELIDTNFVDIFKSLSELGAHSEDAVSISNRTSGSVSAVMAGGKELARSIAEISTSMDDAKGKADNMFRRTIDAGESTAKMSDVVDAMGGIVEAIQEIASQINLLALNATIEAARAGDAGKGFAVVANEVKNLANQAARATEDISNEIVGIQNITSEVVGALSAIRSDAEGVLVNVESISEAVDAQTSVTDEVSNSIVVMKTSVADITSMISQIQSSANLVSDTINRTKQAAMVLAR